MRIGFLFNHYSTHQVPHSAPYAFELSRLRPEWEVILACSSAEEEAFARQIGELYPGHHCRYHRLPVSWWTRWMARFKGGDRVRSKRKVLANNLPFFRSLDALVAPEKNCLNLRTKYGLRSLRMIHTRHGAGDRAGSFDARSAQFDFSLLPGQKYADRHVELGMLKHGDYALTGWPKFEVVQGLQPELESLFDNDNPVVLYCPHFDQDVASWGRMGTRVLEFFAERSDLNLIFAPHVMLFERADRHGAVLDDRFRSCPNIKIDLGSRASNDMTYIRAADIYLGDVSSQVYEFLLHPRPCIFLNAHRVDWESDPNYHHWALGPVVEEVESQLGPAIDAATTSHGHYEERQREAFDYTFHSTPGTTASRRGAEAIASYLEGASGATCS